MENDIRLYSVVKLLTVFICVVFLMSNGRIGPCCPMGQEVPAANELDLSSLDAPKDTPQPASTVSDVSNSPQNTNAMGTGNTANAVAPGQSAETAPKTDPAASVKKTQKFTELVLAGGWVGAIIFLLSLIACTLVIHFLLVFRRSVLMPSDFQKEVTTLLESGRIRQAMEQCRREPSPFANALLAGLLNGESGMGAVERGVEDAVAEETATMYRKVEYLSVIGNIAPMLGLLGTVIGMVMAFGELAASDGLGRNLAQGIYFALVTTVEGLLVAIPALLAYALFNSRVAVLASELTHSLETAIRPLRKPAIPPAITPPADRT